MMNSSVHKQIGKNLRTLRLAKEMTQEQLGKKVGISYQQIQKYETGINAINPDKMIRIAQVLNCEIADLYRGLVSKEHTPFNWDELISRCDLSIVYAYHAIQSPKQKAALLALAKTLSGGEVNA